MADDNTDLVAPSGALQLVLANAVCGLLQEEQLSPADRQILREQVARFAREILSVTETGASRERKEAMDVILGVQLTHLASAIAELDEQ